MVLSSAHGTFIFIWIDMYFYVTSCSFVFFIFRYNSSIRLYRFQTSICNYVYFLFIKSFYFTIFFLNVNKFDLAIKTFFVNKVIFYIFQISSHIQMSSIFTSYRYFYTSRRCCFLRHDTIPGKFPHVFPVNYENFILWIKGQH